MSGRKMNPPIRGHELFHEGRVLPWGPTMCGCQCGAKPDNLHNLSINAMKRWHRQHKADLRSELEATS